MYRATTPLHTYTFPSDPNVLSIIEITYRQLKSNAELTVEKSDLTMIGNNQATYRFTQEQTKLFNSDEPVSIQCRIKDSSGNVAASAILTSKVKMVLDDSIL